MLVVDPEGHVEFSPANNLPDELPQGWYTLYFAPTGIPKDHRFLPCEPSDSVLTSMAIRYDHGLGVDGYYGEGHQQRLEGTKRIMRQIYEEAVGLGFCQNGLPSPGTNPFPSAIESLKNRVKTVREQDISSLANQEGVLDDLLDDITKLLNVLLQENGDDQ